ncbi:hypothetical protein JHC09_01925 [Devosia sp. MC532]|uniref:hypothetical protein n=1 Tax=Devosia sp. MC532 TaxID=2799788 RepID=UPI0018F6CCC2|nr:hypothetical protein [Devosia sp. MC532]MBJ7576642.1 hypothetical protein [Devosia sp. MC532]
MNFKVVAANYDAEHHFLSYTATGAVQGNRFTVSSKVRCLKDPQTPERTHMVVLLALSEHFKRPNASGYPWYGKASLS